MKVTLTRRWGPYRAGKQVDVDDVQGAWLVQHNYAESTPEVQAPEQPAAAEGAHGADPLAGGDATRRRPRVPRKAYDPDVNRALAGEGVPPTYRAGHSGPGSKPAGDPALDQPADKKPARHRSKSES